MSLSAEKRSASVLRPWWDVSYSSCLYALIGLGKKDKNNFPISDISHIKARALKGPIRRAPQWKRGLRRATNGNGHQ